MDDMEILKVISELPGVESSVLGDADGGLIDALDEPDGEATAAVAGFTTHKLSEAGEILGLGPLESVNVQSSRAGSAVIHTGRSLLTLRLTAKSPASGLEERVRGIIERSSESSDA